MATQLSEITRMHPMKISEAHERVKTLAWEPRYQPVLKYPTDYKLEAKFAPTDLMKQVMRSYFPMQEEKDNRVFGTLDGALRGGMFRDVQPRWVEWMKFFLGFMPFPEISAARAMALLANVVPSNEIKNGLTFQMIDEVRHGTQQQALKKWYMENFIDPAGFDITEKAFGNCYASTIARVEALAGVAIQTSDPCGFVGSRIEGKTAVASNAPYLAECGITSLPGVRSGFTDLDELRAFCAWADVGITGADYALADTGTLVMLSSAQEARLISLLPPAHIAVVPRERLLTGLDELFTILPKPADVSSSMVIITGPSRTADIEQFLVRGVHGPGTIHVVLV